MFVRNQLANQLAVFAKASTPLCRFHGFIPPTPAFPLEVHYGKRSRLIILTTGVKKRLKLFLTRQPWR